MLTEALRVDGILPSQLAACHVTEPVEKPIGKGGCRLRLVGRCRRRPPPPSVRPAANDIVSMADSCHLGVHQHVSGRQARFIRFVAYARDGDTAAPSSSEGGLRRRVTVKVRDLAQQAPMTPGDHVSPSCGSLGKTLDGFAFHRPTPPWPLEPPSPRPVGTTADMRDTTLAARAVDQRPPPRPYNDATIPSPNPTGEAMSRQSFVLAGLVL